MKPEREARGLESEWHNERSKGMKSIGRKRQARGRVITFDTGALLALEGRGTDLAVDTQPGVNAPLAVAHSDCAEAVVNWGE